MSKIVVISLKPEFSELIFNGSKKIELRKSIPQINEEDIVVVYNTMPEKAFVGVCKIKEIITSSPEEIWSNYSQELGIDKERYFDYYLGRKKAIGLKIDSFRKFKEKITLKEIKKIIPEFTPPQTFKYFSRSMVMSTLK
ncbi:ASCH domain-containing protein [Snuella sedimenti]|uniref:EVE domain-containing protein n=1 Tax=Snuella sedimenti TaxID=2798802 RepID=A0A8J7LSZ6_9FLAO|nr:ASCH domain-containing protein [Snuella sedimenti]MBJ6367716.1 EVE domain-containing protein [Snuella sedimenti]